MSKRERADREGIIPCIATPYRAGAVRLRSSGSGPVVDITATLSQIEANTDLSAEVFDLELPAGTTSMTLEELREAGPLRDAR